MDKINASRKAGKVGHIMMMIKPDMNITTPVNIPVFRPRLSPITAKKGPKTPVNERKVTASEIVVKSIPMPRANTARNGYTIRKVVFSTTLVAVKMNTWKRRRFFNFVSIGKFSLPV